jgi:hypothetical protein
VTKSAAGRRAKRRGKVGEREVAALLREWGYDARRGQQRSGLDQADVIGLPGWHVEVKRVESLNVWQAFAQAERDAEAEGRAMGGGQPGSGGGSPDERKGPSGARSGQPAPLVAARRDNGPWLAVVRLEHLLALIRDAAHIAPLGERDTFASQSDRPPTQLGERDTFASQSDRPPGTASRTPEAQRVLDELLG